MTIFGVTVHSVQGNIDGFIPQFSEKLIIAFGGGGGGLVVGSGIFGKPAWQIETASVKFERL